jgi:hypothetical protein
VSSGSRARGDADKRKRGGGDDASGGATLSIGLEHMRYRHLAWMCFGLVTGSLLVWKLGTVGVWVGVVLLAVGAFAAYSFVRTLVFPAGTIVISDEGAALPRGLCKGDPERMPIADVAHAYLLRRAVPWTRAAPVLVIEGRDRAFSYPRDWFITEADQRRVVRELHSRGVGRGADVEPDASDADDADDAPDASNKAASEA